MRHFLFATIIFLAPALVQAQCYSTQFQGQQSSCYSQQYQAPEPVALATNVCGAQLQTQTYTVHIPVQVAVVAQPVAVANYGVALASPCQQSLGFAQPFAVGVHQQFGFSSYGGYSSGFQSGFSNRGFVNQGFNQRFGAGVSGGGAGVSIAARDRRGTQVIANGANNVRIQRGLFGRINGATADANRGLLGRISPF